MRWFGLPVTLLLTVGHGLAVTVFYVEVSELVPALHSVLVPHPHRRRGRRRGGVQRRRR